jgi:hypothetical protein
MERDEQTLIPKHPDSSPKLKSCQDRCQGGWRGCWLCWFVSRWRSVASRPPTCARSVRPPPEILSQDSITLDPVASSLCRIATWLCSPVLWRHKGQRPWQVEWHVLRVWWDISARWTRQEHMLHFPEMPSSSCNNTHNKKAQTKAPSTLGVSSKC